MRRRTTDRTSHRRALFAPNTYARRDASSVRRAAPSPPRRARRIRLETNARVDNAEGVDGESHTVTHDRRGSMGSHTPSLTFWTLSTPSGPLVRPSVRRGAARRLSVGITMQTSINRCASTGPTTGWDASCSRVRAMGRASRGRLAIGDEDEVGSELRVDGTQDGVQLPGEDDGVEFLHHLTRFERPEFAAFFRARTRGM